MCGIYNYCQWNEWVNEYINCSLKTPALWALHSYCIPFMHCSSLNFAVGLSKVDLWMCESIYSPATAKSDFSYLLLINVLLHFVFIYPSNMLSISLDTMNHGYTGLWLCLENWSVYFLDTLYLVLGTIGHRLASFEYFNFLIHPLMFLCD